MSDKYTNPISSRWVVIFTIAITIIWLTSPFFQHPFEVTGTMYLLGLPAGLVAIVTAPNAWRWLYNEVRAMSLR